VLGADAATELVEQVDADVVVNGITGSIGLLPTMAALRSGKTLALANKESLIVGGRLVTDAAQPGQIVPVDSEHSALAQCLLAGEPREVRKLILTASGGPFRGYTREQLTLVTPQQALAHPTWVMGKVVRVSNLSKRTCFSISTSIESKSPFTRSLSCTRWLSFSMVQPWRSARRRT
jgi:1-deoxy-D-xylulose-5-phosphate reductoisomerase